MKFKVSFPLTSDMSPISYLVRESASGMSKEEDALWHYNRSRDHDGLSPLNRLPRGTKFEPIFEVDSGKQFN